MLTKLINQRGEVFGVAPYVYKRGEKISVNYDGLVSVFSPSTAKKHGSGIAFPHYCTRVFRMDLDSKEMVWGYAVFPMNPDMRLDYINALSGKARGYLAMPEANADSVHTVSVFDNNTRDMTGEYSVNSFIDAAEFVRKDSGVLDAVPVPAHRGPGGKIRFDFGTESKIYVIQVV